jgi:SAM-dependent methyltransferase
LWEGLINEWQISRAEADYIDRQQGETCDSCGSNLRSIALANALRAFLGTNALLREVTASPVGKNVSILEINGAGMLTPFLKSFDHYVFGAYPEIDMHAMPYGDGVINVVIHSDTLEHIKNPVHALTECRRVLKPSGALCFTVPIIVGRLSRNRDGLPRSYHGSPGVTRDDFVVQTEFGADAWTYVLEAGFTDVSIHSVGYPAAIAFVARNGWAR